MIRAPHRPTFVLLGQPLPETEGLALLGRFVADPTRPTDERVPAEDDVETYRQVVTPSQSWRAESSSFSSQYKNVADKRAKAMLETLFCADASTGADKVWKLTADRLITRRLKDHKKVFKQLMKDEEIREDLREMLEDNRNKAYMIVATRSSISSKVNLQDHRGTEAGGQIALPV
jgi:hypothetical protein